MDSRPGNAIDQIGNVEHHIDHDQIEARATVQHLQGLQNGFGMNHPCALCHGHFRGQGQLTVETADNQNTHFNP